MSDLSIISPPLAARLAELKECGLDLQVISMKPDHLIALVRNGNPEPFLMAVSVDVLPNTKH